MNESSVAAKLATSGIHHVTAIASDPQRNLDFYTRVLGLRLVKLTVNFDDPGSYHFYFGDAGGSPGTILTFFPWPMAQRGRSGTGQVVATSFGVPRGSLTYWRSRLNAYGVSDLRDEERFGATAVCFADPDGMEIEILESPHASLATWEPAGVVSERAITGFHSVAIAVDGYERTAKLLTETLGFAPAGEDRERFRFRAAGDGPGVFVDVLCRPDTWPGTLGAGIVHHVAFRARDKAQQTAMREEVRRLGFNVTPIVDRNYFESIYFREPGGTLFEIATDGPGFAADEPAESLGTSLKLPPQYEHKRAYLEARLPKLVLPGSAARSDGER